jgi:hypothetical protein
LVLIVVDADAPNGYNAAGNYPEGFLHWLLYNMAPTTSSIQEGGTPSSPAIVGENGYGSNDYRGPCPPPATGLHRYFFQLYALDGPIAPATPTEMDVEQAMAGRTMVATATLVGTFGTLQPGQQPSNPAGPTAGQPAVPTMGITYPAGWNLIAAPTGTVITGASLPLYTWQNGDVAYASSNTTQPGFGYWAYFPAQSTIVMTVTAPTTITKAVLPNVYIMIGNAGSTPATVSGADVVYIYNPTSGYQTTNVLQPGQGAWVLSLSGGNVTLTNGQG